MDSPSIYNSTTINLNSRCGFGFVSSRRGRCETIIGTVVFTNATQTPGNKRSRRKYGGAASVLDSTFMNQFSRKLREIETHSDYGNIEIVVR